MTNRLISPRLWTAFFSLEPRLSSLNTTSNVQLIPNFFISLSLVPFKCKTIITVCFLHNNPCGFFQGKVKYQKLPSGNSDYIEFYDKKGEMVTTYSNNDRDDVYYQCGGFQTDKNVSTYIWRQYCFICRTTKVSPKIQKR